MSVQFPPREFDEWAATYDQAASANTGFPFDGYARVLEYIVDLAKVAPGNTVLDLGIGTGNLSLLFAQKGCQIWGVDFSERMLALARTKLPDAILVQADLRHGIQPAFQHRFDIIVSAYTFHHFPLEEKIALVERLFEKHLNPGGQVLIGDIAFENKGSQQAMRQTLGTAWEQEFYWLADETLEAFSAAGIACRYQQISSCAGVFDIQTG